MAIWPLLPLAISLVGALILWLLPAREVGYPIRRWVHVALLLVISGAVTITWGRGTFSESWTSTSWLGASGQLFSFSFDSLGGFFVLLLCGSFLIEELASLNLHLRRGEAVSSLLLVAATAMSCAAADLVTLCLGWGLVDLAFLGYEGLHATQREESRAGRHIWSNLVSTLLLIVAAIWVASEQGRTVFASFAFTGTPLVLLTVAAWIRMGAYPLPGGVTDRWATMLVSMCAGGCFWARLAGLTWLSLREPPWLLAAGGALLVVSLLAAIEDDVAAPQHIIRYSVALMVLGPMLDRETGFAVIILAATTAALSLAVLENEKLRAPLKPLRHWNRLPSALSLTALAGLPLTTGFGVSVLMLSLCAESGLWGVYLLILAANSLFCVALWRKLRAILGARERPIRLSAMDVLAAVGTASAGLALFGVGLKPGLIESFWAVPFPVKLPSWGAILQQTNFLGALLFASVVPVGLGFLLLHAFGSAGAWSGSLAQRASAIGRLDWLYAPVEEVLGALRNLGRRILITLEESFALGWTLLWSAAIVLYLVGR